MVRVEFLGPIKEESMQLDIHDLHGLRAVLQQKESVSPWLPMSAVSVNDVLVEDLQTPLKDGDRVMVLPPVCGGWMLEVFEGALDTAGLYVRWESECVAGGAGALCVFTGVVRPEGPGFQGLSFDLYLPLLQAWFGAWQHRARSQGVLLKMAHSSGDVPVHRSSYMVGLISEHRKASLALYVDFIEDFKHSAPIWKYDLKNNRRVYAKERSHPLKGSGLLAWKGGLVDSIKVGIVVTSDRASLGIYEDLGGGAIKEVLSDYVLNPLIFEYRLIADEQGLIEQTLKELSDVQCCDLIVTTGGTGPALRDVTPEATEAVCSKLLPGFGELMRTASLKYVPTAILSRQSAGIRGSSLIVNLPGKPKSIRECLEVVFPAVPYCIDLIGGHYIEGNAEHIQVFRPKK